MCDCARGGEGFIRPARARVVESWSPKLVPENAIVTLPVVGVLVAPRPMSCPPIRIGRYGYLIPGASYDNTWVTVPVCV